MADEHRHGPSSGSCDLPGEPGGADDRASMRLGSGRLRPQVAAQVVQQVVQRLITGLEERITTAEWPDEQSRLLEALYVLGQARNAAQIRINALVDAARLAGASWAQISKALGMTRQAAHARYRHHREQGDGRRSAQHGPSGEVEDDDGGRRPQ